MRHIQKGAEPQEFINWKSRPSKNVRKFKDLRGKVKRKLYESLIREQGGICAYCERQLVEVGQTKDYHIDHLIPRSAPGTDDLDYNNLLCSCLRNPAEGDPLHCGQLKADEKLPVHPLQKDCQSKFTYTAVGEIDGVDQLSRDTIEILGLNIAKLTDMRKKAVSPFLTDEIDHKELKAFVTGYITPNEEGKRNAFCSMIEHLFKELVEIR